MSLNKAHNPSLCRPLNECFYLDIAGRGCAVVSKKSKYKVIEFLKIFRLKLGLIFQLSKSGSCGIRATAAQPVVTLIGARGGGGRRRRRRER